MKGRAKKSSESLADHVLDEIGGLKSVFAEVIASYSKRIQSELREIEEVLVSIGTKKHKDHTADMRELLNLMRNLQVKPEKGRRKDLKKIDSLVGDLNLIVENLRSRVAPRDTDPEPKKPTGTKVGKNTGNVEELPE